MTKAPKSYIVLMPQELRRAGRSAAKGAGGGSRHVAGDDRSLGADSDSSGSGSSGEQGGASSSRCMGRVEREDALRLREAEMRAQAYRLKVGAHY